MAITGSVGKTSTKDAAYTVFSSKFSTRKSEQRNRNHELALEFDSHLRDQAYSDEQERLKIKEEYEQLLAEIKAEKERMRRQHDLEKQEAEQKLREKDLEKRKTELEFRKSWPRNNGFDSPGRDRLQNRPGAAEAINIAGWSSPVARQAHNLEVIGSNPVPATNKKAVPSRNCFLLISIVVFRIKITFYFAAA